MPADGRYYEPKATALTAILNFTQALPRDKSEY
jgi:hypothetical protein